MRVECQRDRRSRKRDTCQMATSDAPAQRSRSRNLKRDYSIAQHLLSQKNAQSTRFSYSHLFHSGTRDADPQKILAQDAAIRNENLMSPFSEINLPVLWSISADWSSAREIKRPSKKNKPVTNARFLLARKRVFPSGDASTNRFKRSHYFQTPVL
jgi:hypothetical protein